MSNGRIKSTYSIYIFQEIYVGTLNALKRKPILREILAKFVTIYVGT